MGNCLRHESEMHWAGEDWDDFITQDEEDHHHHSSKKTSTKARKTVNVKRESKSCDPPHHEIKIRLTRKQLQDLLNKVNVHDLTGYAAPDIDRKNQEGNQHRLWKPVLQSIPEVD
ncbi:BnaA05g18720D [Brassica napus]|uniref:(rape) hypothetical protein n=1 Tax=Brassica napus TaxID=3708 RepID=A0A078GJQ3_BRANA|nr:uncharacterized protein LOC125608826 [Brassica napus]CAF2099845.1 unnamed protein product [Brassica napus]CDY25412.1 BnaA05g18720D [Brassica napus]